MSNPKLANKNPSKKRRVESGKEVLSLLLGAQLIPGR
jgi:hypothetical protein